MVPEHLRFDDKTINVIVVKTCRGKEYYSLAKYNDDLLSRASAFSDLFEWDNVRRYVSNHASRKFKINSKLNIDFLKSEATEKRATLEEKDSWCYLRKGELEEDVVSNYYRELDNNELAELRSIIPAG